MPSLLHPTPKAKIITIEVVIGLMLAVALAGFGAWAGYREQRTSLLETVAVNRLTATLKGIDERIAKQDAETSGLNAQLIELHAEHDNLAARVQVLERKR